MKFLIVSFSSYLSFILFQSILPYSCHHLVFDRESQIHRVYLPRACRPTSLLAECLEPCFCIVRPNTIIFCHQPSAGFVEYLVQPLPGGKRKSIWQQSPIRNQAGYGLLSDKVIHHQVIVHNNDYHQYVQWLPHRSQYLP